MGTGCEDGVIFLEEKPSDEFNPTEEEVRNYAEWLGIDPEADEDLMYLAIEGLKAPLTDEWKACQNAEGEIFYFNLRTSDSSWDHPADATYRQHVEDKKREKRSASGGRVGETPVLRGSPPATAPARGPFWCCRRRRPQALPK
ncbi:unnamed protein product [Prorocentrum cordatum]|uniref:WW domain-containing protein n=1 Tax=Prorocentrum cordatum TaxID=2364126 RepID=A0ABN9U5K7_9DINO|nr:unnamed protein product [Polarella glacialis]|mmetsp:Transcript_63827/g.172234  ORF Transcript_63827/g.172234 Transcript_63827/m.172234 type:complete len:143 (+) Transcript_63827:33-461(+)